MGGAGLAAGAPAAAAGAGACTQMFPSSLGFGPPGRKRFEGINHKRKRLEIDLNFFDRFGGSEFVNGSHGENRLALI